MNTRKIVNFFAKTLVLGGIVGLLTSFIVRAGDYGEYLSPFDAFELLGVLLFFIGLGLVFTVVAQTGFFAYLFVHRYGESIFKSFWPAVQVLVILFALFDLVYFSAKAGEGKTPFIFYIIMTAVIFIVSIITARVKVKQTNRTAFIPAVFFMVVITGLELSLVLRAGDMDYIILMLVPVLFSNSYQIIKLQEATEVDEEHQRRMEERRKEREKLRAKQAKAKKEEAGSKDKETKNKQGKKNDTKSQKTKTKSKKAK